MANQAHTDIVSSPQDAAEDTLFSISSDLEGAVGKVQCLDALLGRMADDAGDDQDALILHHFRFTVQALYEEQHALVHRLYAMARRGRS